MAYSLASSVLLPYTLIVLAILALAVWGVVRRRPGRWMWLGAALGLAACSNGAVASALAATLERSVPQVSLPSHPPALIVLSGGMLPGADGRPVLATDSLVRTLYAAQLQQRLQADWIVASGGPTRRVPGGGPIGAAMRDLLVQLGVPAERILVEGASQTTYENAVFTARLLETKRIRRVVLVTEAMHMPRALQVFRATSLDVTPAPCCGVAQHQPRWKDGWLPSPSAALTVQRVAHEWIGMAWYRWRGYGEEPGSGTP
jgi:uncharacterized SAM-binding protein YcdF (DUF218 family)